MEFLRYRHVVNLGDLISVLPGIKHLYEITGKKAIIYQQLNRPGEYYVGAQHPTVDVNGSMVCFNQECFDMMRPLLLAQDYIEDFQIYNGQQVDYDLDVVRQQTYCGAPNFPLHKWLWMAYPEMTCDLSKSWIKFPFWEIDLSAIPPMSPEEIMRIMDQTGVMFHNPQKKNIVINFTERYRNYNINYFFLKKYESSLQFIGTEKEYELFSKQWGIEIPHHKADDFLHLSTIIGSCDFFLGNQSFAWHLAQAMQKPRILELYPYAQNCTNFGANGYEAYHQHGIEYAFNKLYNE